MTHDPKTYRFFLMTVDPVHVGTGGARLGRVDNPIVREPGTNLPKIPGSSLHGVIRTYAAHRYGKPQCAGQGQQEGRKHCGRPTCPICYTFGYARDREGGRAGVVAIGDARILLFPVYSMVGPVWVTGPLALEAAGFGSHQVSPGKARWGGTNSELPTDKPLNLGWLMVGREGNFPSITNASWEDIPEQIRNRVVLVSDKLFSQIVNSNLEVRTSVAINPETGAAKEGALFTYEAIPRATILWMDVVVSDYRDKTPWQNQGIIWKAYQDNQGEWHDNDQRGGPLYPDTNNPSQPETINGQPRGWKSPIDVIQAGLEWTEHLGVGGMGTRGFGRIRKLTACPVKADGTLDSPCPNEDDAHGGTEDTEESSP